MFPYPSGAGLHVGHPEGLHRDRHRRALQADARLQRAAPDGLGRLRPARRAVRDQDRHAPARSPRARNIDDLQAPAQGARLLLRLGRARSTPPIPATCRWTQWIFLQLFERGLAYEAEVPVNWCPALGTVLANEEVIDGKSERGGHPVVRRADAAVDAAHHRVRRSPARGPRRPRLARADQEDAARLDRPLARARSVRFARRRVTPGATIEVFTTRPDTLFGATYMVLAPEHPLVDADHDAGAARGGDGVRRRRGAPQRASARRRREDEDRRRHRRLRDQSRERRARSRSGSPTTCSPATAPARSWPCPAHDERDFEFARDVRPADRRGGAAGGDVDAARRTPATASP